MVGEYWWILSEYLQMQKYSIHFKMMMVNTSEAQVHNKDIICIDTLFFPHCLPSVFYFFTFKPWEEEYLDVDNQMIKPWEIYSKHIQRTGSPKRNILSNHANEKLEKHVSHPCLHI